MTWCLNRHNHNILKIVYHTGSVLSVFSDQVDMYGLFQIWVEFSVGFTYRLDRLKPRTSNIQVLPFKVYTIFDTVTGLSYSCCYNALYSLNKGNNTITELRAIFQRDFSNFPCIVELHSEYCRILDTPIILAFIQIDYALPHLPVVARVGDWEGSIEIA